MAKDIVLPTRFQTDAHPHAAIAEATKLETAETAHFNHPHQFRKD